MACSPGGCHTRDATVLVLEHAMHRIVPCPATTTDLCGHVAGSTDEALAVVGAIGAPLPTWATRGSVFTAPPSAGAAAASAASGSCALGAVPGAPAARVGSVFTGGTTDAAAAALEGLANAEAPGVFGDARPDGDEAGAACVALLAADAATGAACGAAGSAAP